jgi:hypothetical protein
MYHTNTTDSTLTTTHTTPDPLAKLFNDIRFMTGDFLTTLLTKTTPAELQVWLAMRWFACRGKKDICYASARRLSEKTGLHAGTVRHARAGLCRKGFLLDTGRRVLGIRVYQLVSPPTPPPDTTVTTHKPQKKHVRNLSGCDEMNTPPMCDEMITPPMCDEMNTHISLGSPYHLSPAGRSLLRVYDSEIKKMIKRGGLKKKGGVRKEIQQRVQTFLLKAGYSEKEAKRLALNTVDINTGNGWIDKNNNPIICPVTACVHLADKLQDILPLLKQRKVPDTNIPPIPESEKATPEQIQELREQFGMD